MIKDNILNLLTGRALGEFQKRILLRHRTFWQTPDAEVVRNTTMNASDPLEKWKEVRYWQRRLSNKYNSREFAKMHGCPVALLYWKGNDPAKLDWSSLPKQYVIRPTIGHSCDLVFLMDEGYNFMDKKRYTRKQLIQLMSKALQKNPYQEFLFEEFLRTEDGEYKIPDDYKVHVFNGEIARIEVINRTSPSTGFISTYNTEWVFLQNINNKYPPAPPQKKPECLDQIVDMARKLSSTYEIYVRIDFYATDKGAFFGEFTPTPGLGGVFTGEADKYMVDCWDKFCFGKI